MLGYFRKLYRSTHPTHTKQLHKARIRCNTDAKAMVCRMDTTRRERLVMDHFYYSSQSLMMTLLVPPILGAGVGLLLGLVRGRPGRGLAAGMVGGTAGTWVGVMAYRLMVLSSFRDELIYTSCVGVGFLLGILLLAYPFSGPPNPARASAFRPISSISGFVLGGLLGAASGLAIACMLITPGSSAGLESLGYFELPIVGMVLGGLVGLTAVRCLGKGQLESRERKNSMT